MGASSGCRSSPSRSASDIATTTSLREPNRFNNFLHSRRYFSDVYPLAGVLKNCLLFANGIGVVTRLSIRSG